MSVVILIGRPEQKRAVARQDKQYAGPSASLLCLSVQIRLAVKFLLSHMRQSLQDHRNLVAILVEFTIEFICPRNCAWGSMLPSGPQASPRCMMQ